MHIGELRFTLGNHRIVFANIKIDLTPVLDIGSFNAAFCNK
jgi:hypothetical protein